MRIPDYRKRAAKAAENWKRLQIEEQAEKNDFLTEAYQIEKLQKSRANRKINPLKAVKGIKISEKVIKKAEPQELRDTA